MATYRLRTAVMTAAAAAYLLYSNAPAQAAGYQVGDVIGEALKTDIAAYVNGKPIPSMNIDGYTAVAVEDLRSYGFEVAWMPYSRKLMITDEPQAAVSGLPVVEPDAAGPAGSKLSDVLYTDIETRYNGRPIKSFNMNGRTAISLNDLDPFGTVVWQPEQRTLSYFASGYKAGTNNEPNSETSAKRALRLRQTDEVKMTVDFQEEQLLDNGKEIGFGKEGLPYFDVGYFAERFGYSMTRYGSRYIFDNGRYSFSLDTASKQAETYWGDLLQNTVNPYIQPFVKDHVLYAYSIDLERLFGYKGIWHQEERKLDISYSRYEVEDYGLPTAMESDELKVSVPVSEIEPRAYYSAPLSISLDNGGIFGNGSRASGSPAEPEGDGIYASSLDCTIRLNPGNNPISEKIVIGERIVYQAQYSVHASFEKLPLVSRWKGFSLEGEGFATVHRASPKFELKGMAPGSAPFKIAVYKLEDGKGYDLKVVQELSVQPDEQGKFTMPIDLEDGGSGVYRVNVLLPRTVPRAGLIYQEFDHFYIALE